MYRRFLNKYIILYITTPHTQTHEEREQERLRTPTYTHPLHVVLHQLHQQIEYNYICSNRIHKNQLSLYDTQKVYI